MPFVNLPFMEKNIVIYTIVHDNLCKWSILDSMVWYRTSTGFPVKTPPPTANQLILTTTSIYCSLRHLRHHPLTPHTCLLGCLAATHDDTPPVSLGWFACCRPSLFLFLSPASPMTTRVQGFFPFGVFLFVVCFSLLKELKKILGLSLWETFRFYFL